MNFPKRNVQRNRGIHTMLGFVGTTSVKSGMLLFMQMVSIIIVASMNTKETPHVPSMRNVANLTFRTKTKALESSRFERKISGHLERAHIKEFIGSKNRSHGK